MGPASMTCRRSSGVSGPTRDMGGAIQQRSTVSGVPSGASRETSASPTPSSLMAAAASKAGFCRNVSAAAFTALASRGVKARSACCTRLPSWPSTVSGTSSGFWVTK